jgi:hypothetical protein
MFYPRGFSAPPIYLSYRQPLFSILIVAGAFRPFRTAFCHTILFLIFNALGPMALSDVDLSPIRPS